MKTLYVSDLDGTLLGSDQRMSDFSIRTINELSESGMLFTYATARSWYTAHKVTEGLEVRVPLIVYNGIFTCDNSTGRIMSCHTFGEDVQAVLDDIFAAGNIPVVYAMVDGRERSSYILDRSNAPTRNLILSRNDVRLRSVETIEQLRAGEIFYITCIDSADVLLPIYEKWRDTYYCVYQKDIYDGSQWLEIMPAGCSKANAIGELKQRLGCDRVVVFGDGVNDLPMFMAADEAYAVANAVPELKAAATGVIGGNNEDGVARWLLEHC